MSSVRDALDAVRQKIDDARRIAGREDRVTLVAVSKRQPWDRVQAAFDAGHRDFGENYVQGVFERKPMLPEARWHLIGHVQSKKAKRAASADWLHTIDTARIARKIGGHRDAASPLRSLVEVNLANEATKSGVAPAALEPLISDVRTIAGIELVGLMCIPPVGEGRRYFSELRRLRDAVVAKTGAPLTELSMGMSGDYEDAVLEGATIVRVGTAIFGARVA